MGNSSTKEARPADARHRGGLEPGLDPHAGAGDRPTSRSRRRASRADLGQLLGIGSSGASSSQREPPHERRETKQEREARRLEKERAARIRERERSIREEHVDGGYLVTLGVYTGPEDFNKQVVRQLQIERKLAPFWRGLNDFDESWAEHQIIAAARGLPIPPADEPPPEHLVPQPRSSYSPAASSQNLNNLTVPIGGRTQSAASDKSAPPAGSTLPSGSAARGSSPFKPRAKALAAALSGGSRNGSSTDITPREINLPHDPFVNGQPLEVFLYKDGSECPICFLYYPPYLNHTRCCDQPICSECFVQIKRPDPHFPENHGDQHGEGAGANPDEAAGQLVSEPACCPYCQQPEFGVTYEPPPFRRGLTYPISTSAMGSMSAAMSSTSSVNSNLSPGSLASPAAASAGGRRRTQSLSVNAPNVITTDRVRPDWATKLAAQRAHQARRAAAATALHTAAFLMGTTESRPFRVSRFSRRNTASNGGTPGGESSPGNNANDGGAGTPSGSEPGPRSSSGRGLLIGGGSDRRRGHMEDLENMMFMEAIRLSLAAEEERKRKLEKEERKEAKKREKEERKAAKAAAKRGEGSAGPYSGTGGSGQSSGSSLSLPGLIGRRRGNSASSNLRMEASVAHAMASTGAGAPDGPGSPAAGPANKGKGVDRGSTPAAGPTSAELLPPDPAAASSTAPRSIPSPHPAAGPSHLRQMSSASSVSSSLPESIPGSYQNPPNFQDPRASGLSLGGRSDASEEGEQGRSRDHEPSASTEPMFNFRSLAEMVGVEIEGENAGRRFSQIRITTAGQGDEAGETSSDSGDKPGGEHVEDAGPNAADMAQSLATLKPEHNDEAVEGSDASPKAAPTLTPPQVMITPETPGLEDEGSGSKQLGFEGTQTVEPPGQVA